MAWALHPEVYRTNVFNLRPAGNRIENLCTSKEWAIPGYPTLSPNKYVNKKYAPELERLANELDNINPNLVVALGNTATWALLGQSSITKIRGATGYSTHTISGFKVLPTYHPAAIMRQWELRPVGVIDLAKAVRERDHRDIRRPKRIICIPETLEDLWAYRPRIDGCERLSVDIETSGTQITCIGFAPDPGTALVIPLVHRQRIGRSYWSGADIEEAVWGFIREVLESSVPKTFRMVSTTSHSSFDQSESA
jgi:hypothetical protein